MNKLNNHIKNILKKQRTSWLLILMVWIILGLILHGMLYQYFQNINLLFMGGLLYIVPLIYLEWRQWPRYDKLVSELHNTYPKLQFSLHLSELSDNELRGLPRIQADKILKVIKNIHPKTNIWKGVRPKALVLLLSSFLYLFMIGPDSDSGSLLNNNALAKDDLQGKSDSLKISMISAKATPPLYTKKSSFSLDIKDGKVPEGSSIVWDLEANKPIKDILLHINDQDPVLYVAKRKMSFFNSSYYHFEIKDTNNLTVSTPFYPISVIKDQSPEVSIRNISEYTRLPWQSNHNIDFTIEFSDDYGIDSICLVATLAKGSGESVKFREKSIPLKLDRKGLKNIKVSHEFSSSALDMEPGSELYFYALAYDNCPYRNQASKSETYFVILEDTVTYAAFDAGGMQVDLMPDFFRSQRQIIIDSEKLLQEKNSITENSFNSRSNELGFDQKTLRLKYGQFLGEEAESGIAIENEIEIPQSEHDHNHDHDHDHDHNHEGNNIEDWATDVLNRFGHNHDHGNEDIIGDKEKPVTILDPEKSKQPDWVEELSHTHDNIEEATFFEMSLRSKLKAALTEMWDAELHLRLYDPASSLPYQYRALKHLQEIKNHARVYVHRIGFDPPEIKEEEKRLSGDLDGIVASSEKLPDPPLPVLKSSQELVEILSRAEVNARIDKNSILLIQNSQTEIGQLAIEQSYLLPLLGKLQLLEKQEKWPDTLPEIYQSMLSMLPLETMPPRGKNASLTALNRKLIESIQRLDDE